VDEETAQKYASMTEGYGNEIRKSIENGEVPHFRLGANDRCPHLNDCGLCKIILSVGEDYLCEICREHPRFYHDTPRGKEVGLGIACEEACRLILTSDAYAEFDEIGEVNGKTEECEIDVLAHRDALFAILLDDSMTYVERLSEIYSTYGIAPDRLTDDAWRKQIASLEYLNDAHRALFEVYSSATIVPAWAEKYLKRALAYWIFRHCSPAYDAYDFLASLGFALFCERLLTSMLVSENIADEASLIELARILSEELEYSEDNTETIKSMFTIA
jgi:lysine-N-methylase